MCSYSGGYYYENNPYYDIVNGKYNRASDSYPEQDNCKNLYFEGHSFAFKVVLNVYPEALIICKPVV